VTETKTAALPATQTKSTQEAASAPVSSETDPEPSKSTSSTSETSETSETATKKEVTPEPVVEKYVEPVTPPKEDQVEEAIKKPENTEIVPKVSPNAVIAPVEDVMQAFHDF